jgi:predicted patatin/cPLA2 family phospholipase
MCLVLGAAGVVDAFDRIYGVSAGALNGWATAVGQAALSATHYEDAARRRVVNRMRALRGRPVIDLDLLFDEIIATRKPLSFERLASGPELRILATSLETLTLRVLEGFADVDELLEAVRASASLPRLGGLPPVFRGERMADGGLIEPIPFETALAEGSTHVLVLRSRPPRYRKPAIMELGELLALRDDPQLLELIRTRHGIYNHQAATLRGSAVGGPRRRPRGAGGGAQRHAPDRPAAGGPRARDRRAATRREGDGLRASPRRGRSLLAAGRLPGDADRGSGRTAASRDRRPPAACGLAGGREWMIAGPVRLVRASRSRTSEQRRCRRRPPKLPACATCRDSCSSSVVR